MDWPRHVLMPVKIKGSVNRIIEHLRTEKKKLDAAFAMLDSQPAYAKKLKAYHGARAAQRYAELVAEGLSPSTAYATAWREAAGGALRNRR